MLRRPERETTREGLAVNNTLSLPTDIGAKRRARGRQAGGLCLRSPVSGSRCSLNPATAASCLGIFTTGKRLCWQGFPQRPSFNQIIAAGGKCYLEHFLSISGEKRSRKLSRPQASVLCHHQHNVSSNNAQPSQNNERQNFPKFLLKSPCFPSFGVGG